jgi:hypothetical protein
VRPIGLDPGMRNSAFRTVTTNALGVKLIIFVKSALSVLWRERHKNFEPFTPKFLGLANLLIRQTV